MKKFSLSILTLVCGVIFGDISTLSAHLDLEKKYQDFVLENKKIEIPGYPNAYNPSIIRWQGKLLLSFREDFDGSPKNKLGVVWLDEEFQPVGKPQLLNIETNPTYDTKAIDIRLLAHQDELYIFFNRYEFDTMRRMAMAKLIYDGKKFSVDSAEYISKYEVMQKDRREKNWVPFVHNDKILLAYSQSPHRILEPIFGTASCKTVATTENNIGWKYGELRGGTTALLDGDEYLSFFHSCKTMSTHQSEGKSVEHYFMGAYTFSKNPPFEITRISPKPILAKGLYKGKLRAPCGFMRVVFPAGMVLDKNYVWVTYGKQDREAWVMKIDKQKLLESLVPVTTLKKK